MHETLSDLAGLSSGTRKTVLYSLKQNGPQSAEKLAAQLGLTAMAVRQHLYALDEAGLVAHQSEKQERGRPRKLWMLSADAQRLFPDSHAELALSLIGSIHAIYGEEGMAQLINSRSREQVRHYRDVTGKMKSLGKKLEALADMRSKEGYMARVEPRDDGWLFIENHCPICSAARSCANICAAELDVFQQCLGPDVSVERSEHLLSGGGRCSYKITAI